jgi:hypothetical protein
VSAPRRAHVDRLTFTKPSKLHIGSVEASCPECGGKLFVRRRQTTHAKADYLACVCCRAETTYSVLLAQVIDATNARSEQVLKEAQALRDALKRPAER